jgi:hypothetical protein
VTFDTGTWLAVIAAADVIVVEGVETERSSMTGMAKAGLASARRPPTARIAAIFEILFCEE